MKRTGGRVMGALLAVFALAVALGATSHTAAPSSGKVSTDLAALASGTVAADPRIARLVPGHRPGEFAYFVVSETAEYIATAGTVKSNAVELAPGS